MTQTLKEHLSVLRSKIEKQRIVVESLKRQAMSIPMPSASYATCSRT